MHIYLQSWQFIMIYTEKNENWLNNYIAYSYWRQLNDLQVVSIS